MVKRMSLVQEMQRWRVRDGWRRASSSEESEAEPSLSLTTRSTADRPRQVMPDPSPRWYRTSKLPTSVGDDEHHAWLIYSLAVHEPARHGNNTGRTSTALKEKFVQHSNANNKVCHK